MRYFDGYPARASRTRAASTASAMQAESPVENIRVHMGLAVTSRLFPLSSFRRFSYV